MSFPNCDIAAAHISEALDARDVVRFSRALEIAKGAHIGQIRDHGAPYIEHPVRVALILLDEFHLPDPDLLCAALLHDAVEDCPTISFDTIESDIGSRVRRIVETLTKPLNASWSREEVNAVYFNRLATADLDCKLVKLADKLDNVRDSQHSPNKAKRARTKLEAQTFFLPLAASLGGPYRDLVMGLLRSAIDDATEFGGAPR